MNLLNAEIFGNVKPTEFIIVKVTEVECIERQERFKLVGYDIAIRGVNVESGDLFEKIYSITIDGKSFDNGYMKPIIKYAGDFLFESNSADDIWLEKLEGQTILIGVDTQYSLKAKKEYENISVFVPLSTPLLKKINESSDEI